MRPTAWRLLAIVSLLSPAVAATRPHYGGTLRVQTKARIAALDPAEFSEQDNLATLVFDRLVSWNESGQPQPALATSWRHDADFKRWEFHLRTGVKFHDGSAFTATVAAASLERMGAAAQADILVIRSEQPAPKLLALMAGAGQSISKRGVDGALTGTGPFRVVKWEAGRRAALAANDDYWAGRPYLDKIEIEMGRTARDQALDFDLNKTDVIELGVADARRPMQNGRKIWASAPADLVALVFDSATDERVREAIAVSIDRATMGVLLQRQGTAAWSLLPQWLSGYAFLFADSSNVERARQIAAGLSVPMPPVTLAYDPQDTTARAIAERIAFNAREAGVAIRPVAGSQTASARIRLVRAGSPDASQALAAIAVALGMHAPTPASPEALYATERSLLQGYRVIPLFHVPEFYGLGSRVRNWTATRWGGWKLDSVWLAQ